MSSRIRVGVAGIGFMGKMHFGLYQANPKSRVTAIADTDAGKLSGAWGAIGGNVGAAGAGSVDLAGVSKYTCMDDLINDADVDLVDITLPTYLHAEYALKALSAGKHVLCEKPITNNLADARKVVAAASRARGKFMVAHCIRFWPEYAWAKEHVVAGREYGKVLAASFRRLSATPAWSRGHWIIDARKGADAALELHVHDADYVRYLFGEPEAVWAHGVVGAISGGGVDHVAAHYRYPGLKQVSAEGGWAFAKDFGFEMGFILTCERATVVCNSTRSPTLAVHLKDGGTVAPPVGAGDAYGREVDYFLNCILQDRAPEVTNGADALKSLALVAYGKAFDAQIDLKEIGLY